MFHMHHHSGCELFQNKHVFSLRQNLFICPNSAPVNITWVRGNRG
ncbi:unnamed protein product [Ixodes hexagonus]